MNSEQGRGCRTQGPAGAGEQVYQGLRAQILGLDPATAGLRQGSEDRVVWGSLMETGYPRGTATLIALADGTTSLYLSGGGGIIGGGSHEAVATATKEYLAELEMHLQMLAADPADNHPAPGQVIIRALTFTGRMSTQAPEKDLSQGRHPLWPVFHAAHRVINELRLIDETRQGKRP
jgi:hypothetical protein